MKKLQRIISALMIIVPFFFSIDSHARNDYGRNYYSRDQSSSVNLFSLDIYLFGGKAYDKYDNLTHTYNLDRIGVADYHWGAGGSGIGFDYVIRRRLILHAVAMYSYTTHIGPYGEAGLGIVLYNFDTDDVNDHKWIALSGGVMLNWLKHTDTHGQLPNVGYFRDTIVYAGLEWTFRTTGSEWLRWIGNAKIGFYYLHGFVNRSETQTYYDGRPLIHHFPDYISGYLGRIHFGFLFFGAGDYGGEFAFEGGFYVPLNF
ncbi:MAG: hypothetical protein JXA20_15585 [Spirochaetes bacterium]|nr:hypothetical protein [Spirochaetota bacterium]